MKKNHIITGIPRSGTSLVSSLIAESINAVVFSEPEWLKLIRQSCHNSKEFTHGLINHISLLRSEIKHDKPINLKINKETQKTISNYYKRDSQGNVTSIKKEESVVLGKNYASQPFYIKSNAQFTACLEDLIKVKAFKIYCIIRNPVSCIMSWRSLNIPVSKGNMKIAENYSDSFLEFTSGSTNLLHKQVLIVDWFFHEYKKHANHVEIIKYEDLLENTDNIISNITSSDSKIDTKLKSANKNQHYDHSEKGIIEEYLAKYCHHYKDFYKFIDKY